MRVKNPFSASSNLVFICDISTHIHNISKLEKLFFICRLWKKRQWTKTVFTQFAWQNTRKNSPKKKFNFYAVFSGDYLFYCVPYFFHAFAISLVSPFFGILQSSDGKKIQSVNDIYVFTFFIPELPFPSTLSLLIENIYVCMCVPVHAIPYRNNLDK